MYSPKQEEPLFVHYCAQHAECSGRSTHVGQQVEQGVAAQRAHGQRHQEGEQKLEEGLVEDGHQDHAQQGQQADRDI